MCQKLAAPTGTKAAPFWQLATVQGLRLASSKCAAAGQACTARKTKVGCCAPLVPRQLASTRQTTIIFDWDDTLLCTSFLAEVGDEPLTPSLERQVCAIQDVALELLRASACKGRTIIVTNASVGWVEHCVATWMPQLAPQLGEIEVIYARDRYEALFPDQPSEWKARTFLDMARTLDARARANVVSLGDSEYELDAARLLGEEFARCSVKTVKFKAEPSPEDLVLQLKLVLSSLDRLVDEKANRDLSIEHEVVRSKGRKRSRSRSAVHGEKPLLSRQ